MSRTTRIHRLGPATELNILQQGKGTIAVPFSTNRWTSDTHFLVDADRMHLLLGHYFYVNNDKVYQSGTDHFSVRCGAFREEYGTELVYRVLHVRQLHDPELVVDHCYHWTDCREASVEIITPEENLRRGNALYSPTPGGRANRVVVRG
jgi:hypothetical protein